MFNTENICPYTGLRSFTEEEALYFEGREEQIDQITRILEKNKFLMVTGASGDGKSSVVFAGIIPNARAGFFKARYTNWTIVDFRPEKSPLKNLSKSLAKALDISSTEAIENELKRGFSSLVEVYKNSSFFIDERSSEWLSANDTERKVLRKRGSNLLILVDQFEELFTTQDNFQNGKPSTNAQTLVNLLLETSRIALKEDLPIYVICTMRSDFIGQCAAFRGLPEYIGFSQFFVPRLKRNQLQDVIEKPAILSGNRIARRLVERLIYDLNEGVDQLPVLQHALNQIWKAADSGNEEMDLIHYAKVGGMSPEELPEDDRKNFKDWFDDLPEHTRKSFESPQLERVLDIHSNQIYENAAYRYNQKYPGKTITVADAKRAIAITFACLCRMDQGRGVRNRITLSEINAIVNNPEIEDLTLGRLIQEYREEGNTLIRPFCEADSAEDLHKEAVLDITHESLIRNWERLKSWAWKEFEYYETFVDFKKQMGRWVENNKARSFLLPVGSLGYFENWYEQCKPNAHWINRYEESEEDPTLKLTRSKQLLEDTRSFLKKSANKHLLAKTFMKYGPRRIGIALAILSTIILSSFYYADGVKKQNQAVINQIYSEAEKSINLDLNLPGFTDAKAEFINIALLHNPDKALNIIDKMSNTKEKAKVAIESFNNLFIAQPDFTGPEKDQLISICDEALAEIMVDTSLNQSELLGLFNQFVTLLAFDMYYHPDDEKNRLIQRQLNKSYAITRRILQQPKKDVFGLATEIHNTLQNINNYSTESSSQLQNILGFISPYENQGKENFDFYFPKSRNMPSGAVNLSYNGGYQLLAEIYASLGEEDLMYRSINKILEDISPTEYSSFETYNQLYTIFGYLIKYKHQAFFDGFLDFVNNTFSIQNIDFLLNFQDRSGYKKFMDTTNYGTFFQNHPGSVNPVLSFLSPESLEVFHNQLNQNMEDISSRDELNYTKAIVLKNKALISYKYLYDRGLNPDVESRQKELNQAFNLFNSVSQAYLDSDIKLIYRYYSDGIRQVNMKREMYFLYPDRHTRFWIGNRYINDFMVEFILNNEDIQSFYETEDKLDLFVNWIYNGNEPRPNGSEIWNFNEKPKVSNLIALENFLSDHPNGSSLDLNLLNLLLCNRLFEENKMKLIEKYADNLKTDKFAESGTRSEYLNVDFFYNQIVTLASNFAKAGDTTKAVKFVNTLDQVHFRMKAYFLIARRVHDSDYPEHSFFYIKKGYDALDQFDPAPLSGTASYYFTIIETLSSLGSRAMDSQADELLQKFYPGGVNQKILGLSRRDKYYLAKESLPASNTIMDDLYDSSIILFEDAKESIDLRWNRVKELNITYGLQNRDYFPFAD